MKDKDIHIGDMVRVRQWEDMKAEGSVTSSGSIKFSGQSVMFINDMKYLCGRTFTVANSAEYPFVTETVYESSEHIECRKSGGRWYLTAVMLEPYDNIEYTVASDDEIAILLQ